MFLNLHPHRSQGSVGTTKSKYVVAKTRGERLEKYVVRRKKTQCRKQRPQKITRRSLGTGGHTKQNRQVGGSPCKSADIVPLLFYTNPESNRIFIFYDTNHFQFLVRCQFDGARRNKMKCSAVFVSLRRQGTGAYMCQRQTYSDIQLFLAQLLHVGPYSPTGTRPIRATGNERAKGANLF